MSVNILYRVLIFTGSGFPNGKMKLLVGKFLVKVANFGDHALKMFSIVKNVLFCHVCFVLFFLRVGKVIVDTVTNNFLTNNFLRV